MRSKVAILTRIKENKPSLVALPKSDFSVFDENVNLLSSFQNSIIEVGGKVCKLDSDNDLHHQIKTQFPNTEINYSTVDNSNSFNTIRLDNIKNLQQLETLDVLVLKGEFGVAENGAIWLSDKTIPIRVLPFITKNLVLVIEKDDIFLNMHHAYKNIKDFEYGVFISGPSKTADIEQSLVIGAQGALSLTVFIK